jgi:hypothetical protein
VGTTYTVYIAALLDMSRRSKSVVGEARVIIREDIGIGKDVYVASTEQRREMY